MSSTYKGECGNCIHCSQEKTGAYYSDKFEDEPSSWYGYKCDICGEWVSESDFCDLYEDDD